MHEAKDRRLPTFIRLVVVPYKVEGIVVEAVNNKKLCYKCFLLSKPENQIRSLTAENGTYTKP